jgi:hypothetical protein
MSTLTRNRRGLSAPRRAYVAGGTVAIQRYFSAGTAAGEQSPEIRREVDLQALVVVAHLMTLLTILFVVREGILVVCFIEHGAMLVAGGFLFFSPARQVGRILLRIVALASAAAFPVWILFALKFCY